MKKHILNIERLFGGHTQNALMMSQVDAQLPFLVPSIGKDDDVSEFSSKWKKVYKDFNLKEGSVEEMNRQIVDFNLSLQSRFKALGHDELYMMDDTQNVNIRNQEDGRKYLHSLNGISEDGKCYSSQLNVLFPQKKLTSKSLFAKALKVESTDEREKSLEQYRCVTLEGKASSEKCLQDIAVVGGKMYTLTPNIDLANGIGMYNNGSPIFNGAVDSYHFPSSLTLFQPSHSYDGVIKSGLVKDYLEWYGRMVDGNVDEKSITFGSYVNEEGISDEERTKRIEQFFTVSRFQRDVTQQSILESSMGNSFGNGIAYGNMYSDGDIYGDVFITKSFLNSEYDMQLSVQTDPRTGKNWLRLSGRNYISIGECGNQLFLVYQPMDYYLGTGGKVVYVGENSDSSGLVQSSSSSSSSSSTSPLNPFPLVIQEEEIDSDIEVAESSQSGFVVGRDSYQMVEVVKNINKFESSIKHKPNVFSVVVENSNLAVDKGDGLDEYRAHLRDSITQFVRNTCEGVVPVHTQLFDVKFT